MTVSNSKSDTPKREELERKILRAIDNPTLPSTEEQLAYLVRLVEQEIAEALKAERERLGR